MAKVRLWRQISPAKLNIQGMRSAFIDTMEDIARDVENDFRRTTETWDHKVSFDVTIEAGVGAGGKIIRLEVSTDDQQYRWVNDGTRRHWEEPVNAKALAFTYQSSPKTMPGVMDSGDFTPGPLDVRSEGHWHPGAEARRFDRAIADSWKGEFRNRMRSEIDKVVKASGHSMKVGTPSKSKKTSVVGKTIRKVLIRTVATAAVGAITGQALPGLFGPTTV